MYSKRGCAVLTPELYHFFRMLGKRVWWELSVWISNAFTGCNQLLIIFYIIIYDFIFKIWRNELICF